MASYFTMMSKRAVTDRLAADGWAFTNDGADYRYSRSQGSTVKVRLGDLSRPTFNFKEASDEDRKAIENAFNLILDEPTNKPGAR